ncbi:hypothetical protein SADUNF_Sadunf07G0089800 [Salix dunnii]|uniref:Trichome birefringence-like N-terminal domain-containing protein n=1 Tax=Salix dunnii TaxID=1413687 RepID=A0A835MU42_9ROSI|nr:hypothetical protein SADUNF_Sadunf07G0089800 [Salix dunnii]
MQPSLLLISRPPALPFQSICECQKFCHFHRKKEYNCRRERAKCEGGFNIVLSLCVSLYHQLKPLEGRIYCVRVFQEMKGANFYRLRGRHFSAALLFLAFTTLFFWTWENNPFATTLWSAQEQSSFHTSEKFSESTLQGIKEDIALDILIKEGWKALAETYSLLSCFGSEFVVNTLKRSSSDSLTPNKHVEETVSDSTSSGESQIPEKEFDASNFTYTFAPQLEDRDADRTLSTKIKDCNYSKGRWVAESRRPLYSGFECKQWLSEMWACRLTQRTDFSFEGYRWQPENCKMLEFEKSAFLRRMQDKTIAFIGDSLGRQQFQSLMCMATGGEWRADVEDVGKEYGLFKPRGAIRPNGWAYRFSNTNTTILYYWSSTLADLEPLNITDKATDVAMHLDRAPAFMRQFLHHFDVLVLNTGHHWNRGKITANHWVMYVNGKPLEDRRLMAVGNAKNLTVHSVARWLDSQLPSHPRLRAFFRTISPRHFRNGDWNTGGNCDNTTPFTGGSEVSQDESSDPVVAAAVKGTNITLLDITALSDLRDEGHISRYSVKATAGVNDCLHWCLPGIPDTWNELLVAQI